MNEYDEEWVRAQCHRHSVPMHMHDGIVEYLVHRRMPGDFLQAVFANDLLGSMSRADDANIRNLRAYGYFLYNALPARPNEVWGSYEVIKAWVK